MQSTDWVQRMQCHILYPINHPEHTRQENAGVISTRISGRVPIAKNQNLNKEASEPFEYTFRQVARTDTEGQQDSSDEKSDKRNEATESAVNCFIECSDLGEIFTLIKQGAKRYLRDLCEQHARGKDSFFSIMCESSLNTSAELKDEACTWFDLI